jgi:hypothetical protein
MKILENKNADSSAFSCASDIGVMREGLTKREYFAGLAMQGIIASGNYSELEVASCAVNLADELLNQLEND